MIETIKILAQVTPPSGHGSCGATESFFGLPTWYKYLDCQNGNPQITSIYDVWNIAWGVIDILLYVGGIAAVLFMIYGGITYITSQGSPDKLSQANRTLIYAAAGLLITIIARAVVNYAFGQL